MDAAASFLPILQVMTAAMTAPTAEPFQTLIVGWLMVPRRTIMGMACGSGTDRHHAAFHRLFAAARWSIDQAGLAVFDLVTCERRCHAPFKQPHCLDQPSEISVTP